MSELSSYLKLGDDLIVTFLDHCENGDGPLTCVVHGRLSSVGEDYIIVDSWHPEIHWGDDENTTSFTIVTSCIKNLVVMKPKVIIKIDSCEADDETHCCGQSTAPNPDKDTSE